MDSDNLNPFADAGARATRIADGNNAAAQATLTASWDSIRQMLPAEDQTDFGELEKIVKASTDHNVKVASLVNNISSLGSVVMKVLSHVP
jgi:hypothetical protein